MRVNPDRRKPYRLFALTGLIVCGFCTSNLSGQAVGGRIVGLVLDPNAGAIPNAQITITNQDTGLRWNCATGAYGYYAAPSLPPGFYRIQVEARGFRTAVSRDYGVTVAQTIRADFTLQIGTLVESVQVASTGMLIESTTSDLGATVGRKAVQALPLNGRIFSQLLTLAPGVLANGAADSPENSSAAGARSPIGASVNGLPWPGTSYMLDGITNKESQNALINIAPPIEAIQEFKVQTNNPTAEFGSFGGAIVNLSIRSGTNETHGSLFEYARNEDLNARNFFAARRAPFKTSQFGATAGGPAVPNRTFFFADYQGTRLRNGQTFTLNVPTAAMRQGIFLPDEGFAAIHDPDNGAIAFPGNRIPVSRIDRVTAKVANLWPLANTGGPAPAANFVQNVSQRQQVDQGDAKGDYQAGSNVRLFVRESYNRRDYLSPSPGNLFMGAGQENSESRNHNAATGYSHVFRAQAMSEFRAGFNRFRAFHFGNDFGIAENNILGIPNGNLAAFPESSGIANFNVSGIQPTGSPLSTNGLRQSTSYQLSEGFTFIRGRHTAKFGGDANRTEATVTNPEANPRGQFDFDGSLTSNQGSGGAAFASFLLGYPNTVTRGFVNTRPDVITYTIGVYVQDDFRVTRSLTLNLGLRWEMFTFPRERRNRQTNFDLSDGRIHTAGPADRGPGLRDFSGPAPRLGVAYTPDRGRTAIRAALGISYFNDNFGANGGSLDRNYPLFETFTLQKRQTFSPFARVSANGLPAFVPVDFAPAIIPAPGITPIAMTRDFRPDEAIMWNFGVQRQLRGSASAEAAYVATRGLHLYRDRLINAPLTPGPGDIDPRRPYFALVPQIQTIRLRASDGLSSYHSLQLKFTRRAAEGLSAMASYTWSKSIDDQNIIWPYDDRLNRGVSNSKANDVRNVFSAGYSWDLPLGTGKRWLAGGARPIRLLVSGWSVNGVATMRTGLPLVIGVATSLLNTGTANRADITCSSVPAPRRVDRWFDTTCFRDPVLYAFGNSGKGHVRGPGLVNFDVSAFRRFAVLDRGSLELRSEFFNVSNTPHFNTPQTVLGNADFGRIASTILTPREVQLGLKFSF